MFLKVIGDRSRVFLQVDLSDDGPEYFLLSDDAAPEVVVLVSAVGDALARALRLPHQVLAVGQVAANLAADHHRQLVDGELRTRSIVPPVVVVRPTDRIQLIRVLVLDYLLSDAILDL